MLKLIADAPRHGYDLIREIEGLTGGGYAPSPGVVYPTLSMLDEMGLIEEQQSEGAKKRFAASDEGRAHLAKMRPWSTVCSRGWPRSGRSPSGRMARRSGGRWAIFGRCSSTG